MLELFEEYTYELNQYEQEVLLPKFVHGFSTKHGAANAVTNKQIIERMNIKFRNTPVYKLNDARVRKLINYIRTHNLIPGLMASSKGYYISDNPAEIEKYIRSLQGREHAIRQVRKSMQDYLQTLNK